MNKNVKGIIAIAVIGILGFIGYKFFAKKYLLKNVESVADDNFKLLQNQLGLKPNVNNPDLLIAFFNNNKNKAQYYKSSNRVFIYDNTTKPPKLIKQGTYSQGGYNITLEGGKDIMNTSSAWATLNDTIK
jgi:hypothetical protein